jgi:hypothetical protein
MKKPKHIEAIECAFQSAFNADPVAMHALVVNRVPCNQKMLRHPYMVVDPVPVLKGEHYQLGLLGVVNGMLSATGEQWRLAAEFTGVEDESGRRRITGFVMVHRSKVDG